MKKDAVLHGKYHIYFSWPIILTSFTGFLVIALFFMDRRSAGIAAICLLVQALISFFLYRQGQKNLVHELIRYAAGYEKAEKDVLDGFVLPMAILDEDGFILWINEAFSALDGTDGIIGTKITELFPEVTGSELPRKASRSECEILYGEHHYRAAMQKADTSVLTEGQELLELKEGEYVIALYLFDEQELFELQRINEENKIVAGNISIDNYDEALESVEEVRRSLLLALIDRKINKYFSEHDGVLKKFEKDRYTFVIRKTQFEKMKADRFSILEEVKDVKVGNEMAVTLSLGFGLNQGSFVKDSEAAQAAIDMALSRGGDQVIIRDNEKVTFFGGRTGAVEKYTRVKARVKAHALQEIISSKERVVIMGHKITDIDALGAAVGIYRAAKTLAKPAFIVIDRSSISIGPMVAEFENSHDYDANMFIEKKGALDIVDEDTVVVVVDTNRPSYTECRELLDKTEAIVVLDHHRQGEEVIKNARLSYIEPYASSACEMASEILQYFDEEVKIRPLEADSMYAGIMVDTDNFNMRTGVRTFEAAAFLRRNGADVTRVRKLFRENLDDYRARAKAISDAELFMDSYAISVCPSEGLASPTIVCSQAANELLNIVNVKASFVLTEYNEKVHVSARAIDEVNVQLIMERLGGGGHMNMAGTQFEGLTIEEVRNLLKKTIREMAEEGDI